MCLKSRVESVQGPWLERRTPMGGTALKTRVRSGAPRVLQSSLRVPTAWNKSIRPSVDEKKGFERTCARNQNQPHMNSRVRPGCQQLQELLTNSLPEQKGATKPEYDNIREFVQDAWDAPRTAHTKISPYPRVRSRWLAVPGPSFPALSRVRSGCLAEERGELSKQPDCIPYTNTLTCSRLPRTSPWASNRHRTQVAEH